MSVKQLIANVFQWFPDRMRGKQRVGRWLLKALHMSNNATRIQGDFGLSYHLLNFSENVSFEIFINGIFEKETVDIIHDIVRNIRRETVILDIGANMGSIAIPLATLSTNSKIYCIEASPRVFKSLKNNIEINRMGARIFPHNVCLSDSRAEFVDFFSPIEQFGKGSLSPVFTSTAENVRNQSLDGFVREHEIANVDFIKIDVEGFEKQIFESGADLLSPNNAPDILFEVCDWAESLAGNQVGDSQRILKEYGYQLYDSERANAPIKDTSSAAFAMILASKNRR